MKRNALRRAATTAPLLLAFAAAAFAAPPTAQELKEWCADSEDVAHCARLVEARQLKRLPALATRDGPNLKIALFPSGTTTFADVEDLHGGKSYSLWESLDPINAVVLLTTEGDTTTFTLLQRGNGRRVVLPADPVLAPDRQRLATADVCPQNCTNEVATWRVTRDGVFKELAWTPPAAWSDVTVTWADARTLLLAYTSDGAAKTAERALAAEGWRRSTTGP